MVKKSIQNGVLLDNVIYSISPDNKYRYSLGTKGKNTLYCFGINPSTATPENYDSTIKKVVNNAREKGFDSFVMLNIYPFRATNPKELPDTMLEQEHNKNVQIILNLVKNGSTIWAAWGNLIDSRPWLKSCRDEITQKINKNKKNIRWVKMGTLTVKNNPRHPLYLKIQDFSEFRV